MWCNPRRYIRQATDTNVSVFSDESRVVQRSIGAVRIKEHVFQYSLTNLVWCNETPAERDLEAIAFQYSLTNLVWCNQDGAPRTDGKRVFQYSLTNLVWCNNRARQETAVYVKVSVFSDESRVVQPHP